jgi:hypothetical protein
VRAVTPHLLHLLFKDYFKLLQIGSYNFFYRALSSYEMMASFHDYGMVSHFLSKLPFSLFFLLLLGFGTIWALEQMDDFM